MIYINIPIHLLSENILIGELGEMDDILKRLNNRQQKAGDNLRYIEKCYYYQAKKPLIFMYDKLGSMQKRSTEIILYLRELKKDVYFRQDLIDKFNDKTSVDRFRRNLFKNYHPIEEDYEKMIVCLVKILRKQKFHLVDGVFLSTIDIITNIRKELAIWV